MIRRFIGITAIVAAVALPALAQAQGVPGGVERGSREGERAAGPVGAVVGGVVGGVVALTGCWASISVPAFTVMSSNNTGRRTSIARTSVSARCCPRKASPITMYRRNTAFMTTATPS
jgi:hypothetical protein